MNRSKEFLVGAVIIASIAVGVGGTVWLQGTNFGRATTTVEVLLESVGQLSEGNPVTYRGVRIGQTASIDVEPGGSGVRVTLLLTEEVELPSDPGVVLGPESLFGDWQAEIVSRARFPRFAFYQVPAGTSTRSSEAVAVVGDGRDRRPTERGRACAVARPRRGSSTGHRHPTGAPLARASVEAPRPRTVAGAVS